MTEKETYTNFKTLLVNILSQNGYTNGKDYKIRYFKSSPYRANRGEKNVQECWLTVRNAPSNIPIQEDDWDDIESLTDYVCGVVDTHYYYKKQAKQTTTFHVGDLICYKGVEESVFKIVGTKGNNYLVVEIGDRTNTENKIPFADNDKLQRAVSPLLITEAKLVKNNKEVKVGDEFIKPNEWELPNTWLSDNIKDKYDLFYVSYVHPDGTIFLYDEQSGKTERYTQSEFYQLGLQFYKHYSKDNGISGTSENLIQDFQENIWKNGFNSVTLRQLKDIIKDIQNERHIQSDFGRLVRYGRPRHDSVALSAAVITRGRIGTSSEDRPTDSRNGQTRITRQTELLTQFAQLSGCWISDYYEQPDKFVQVNGKKYTYLAKGMENAVYDNLKTKNQKEKECVVKIINITPDWVHPFYYDISQLFDTRLIHNALFKTTTLKVVGFAIQSDVFKIVLQQLYVSGDAVEKDEINSYINHRIKPLKPIFNFYFNSDFIIGDFHRKNVLKSAEGWLYVIDDILAFNHGDFKGFKGLGTSTPPKIIDKGDDFSYFDYPKDVIDKFYTYIRITGLDKNIPAFSNYFFDDDGHLCFATSRKEEIEEGIDVDRCLKEYEDLKHEWIAKAEDNINGFIWQFFINDTEFSPRGSYNYKILNRDLVELLLGYARKFEETSEIYPDKLGVENIQDYNKTKEILTKRLAELNKPKQPKKTPTIPTIQPEKLLTFDRNRLSMSCVHCENGYKVVTDAHCILKFKSDYPKQYEGKNVMPKHFFKKFEEFILNPETVLFCNKGSYPNYEPVIKNTLAKTKYSASIDIQSLYQYICALTDYYEKQTGEEIKVENRHRVPFFYNGQHAFSMDIVRLKKWLSAAKLIQADTIKWVDYSYGVVFQNSKSDNGDILLVMPSFPRDTDKSITDGKCLIDVDWDIWYKTYDFANTRKANILITEAKLAKTKDNGILSGNAEMQSAEYEIVLQAREIAQNGESLRQRFDRLVDLYNNQRTIKPTDTKSKLLQQYSTPCPLAFLASEYVKQNAAERYYIEPSAGNGMLTISLPVNHTVVNEIDEVRLENLKKQGFADCMSKDASKPICAPHLFDGVITNPPFKSLPKEEQITENGFTLATLDYKMACAALAMMRNDGRAAVIVGGKMFDNYWKPLKNTDKNVLFGQWKIFLGWLYAAYNVEDLIYIGGDYIYRKQGTTYPVVLILIDGRRVPFSTKNKPDYIYDPIKNKIITTYDELFDRVAPSIQRAHLRVNSSLLVSEAKLAKTKN